MSKSTPHKMTRSLARQCRQLVYRMAAKYEVPAVLITAHTRSRAADRARIETWQVMIRDMGLKRQMVADMFGRDRRRLRRSVIGV